MSQEIKEHFLQQDYSEIIEKLAEKYVSSRDDFEFLAQSTKLYSATELRRMSKNQLKDTFNLTFSEAFACLLDVLKEEIQTHNSHSERLKSFVNKIEYEVALKKYLEALENPTKKLVEILEIENDEFRDVIRIGHTQIKTNQTQKAKKTFTSLILLNPHSYESWYGLAVGNCKEGFLELRNKNERILRFNESIICALEAHKLRPNDVSPLLCIMNCRAGLGEFHEVDNIIRHFQKFQDSLGETEIQVTKNIRNCNKMVRRNHDNWTH